MLKRYSEDNILVCGKHSIPSWEQKFKFGFLKIFFSDPEPVPEPKPKPIPPPAEIKEITTRCILKICAPVLKQTKEMQILFT